MPEKTAKTHIQYRLMNTEAIPTVACLHTHKHALTYSTLKHTPKGNDWHTLTQVSTHANTQSDSPLESVVSTHKYQSCGEMINMEIMGQKTEWTKLVREVYGFSTLGHTLEDGSIIYGAVCPRKTLRFLCDAVNRCVTAKNMTLTPALSIFLTHAHSN